MRDDYLSQDWANHHHLFTSDLHKLLRAFSESMEQLTRQQFDAPWRVPAHRNNCPTQ